MSDSILVTLTKAIFSALETERTSGGAVFEGYDFELDWDFDGRNKDLLPAEDRLYVRIVVPRRWHVIRRFDRGSLERFAVIDIDVRLKLGAASQNYRTNAVDKQKLDRMISLVERIHDYFFNESGRFDFTRGDQDHTSVWAGEMADAPEQSRILVAYSDRYMREQRLFYGCCREVFQVLEKGSED